MLSAEMIVFRGRTSPANPVKCGPAVPMGSSKPLLTPKDLTVPGSIDPPGNRGTRVPFCALQKFQAGIQDGEATKVPDSRMPFA
jgi:hypothetical protein